MNHSLLNSILNGVRPEIEKAVAEQLMSELAPLAENFVISSVIGTLSHGLTKGIDAVVAAAVQHLEGESQAKFLDQFSRTTQAQVSLFLVAFQHYAQAQFAVEQAKKRHAGEAELTALRNTRAETATWFRTALGNLFQAMIAGHLQA